jgi:molybdopterin/thiamine biosynthesis adenylyltransferase
VAINPVRHLEVFSPEKFGTTRVDVVGVGATGSHLAYGLAKLGVKNIHIWDHDTVEDHNLANQLYGLADLDVLKVDAMARLISTQCGIDVTPHPCKLEAGHKDLGEVVFLLVDSMKARKEIAQQCVKSNFKTKLMIETRMGVEQGMIYTIEPLNAFDFTSWEASLYEDEEAETSVCGARTTVGATANWIASVALWQMLYWLKDGCVENNELILSLRPPQIYPRRFTAAA